MTNISSMVLYGGGPERSPLVEKSNLHTLISLRRPYRTDEVCGADAIITPTIVGCGISIIFTAGPVINQHNSRGSPYSLSRKCH